MKHFLLYLFLLGCFAVQASQRQDYVDMPIKESGFQQIKYSISSNTRHIDYFFLDSSCSPSVLLTKIKTRDEIKEGKSFKVTSTQTDNPKIKTNFKNHILHVGLISCHNFIELHRLNI